MNFNSVFTLFETNAFWAEKPKTPIFWKHPNWRFHGILGIPSWRFLFLGERWSRWNLEFFFATETKPLTWHEPWKPDGFRFRDPEKLAYYYYYYPCLTAEKSSKGLKFEPKTTKNVTFLGWNLTPNLGCRWYPPWNYNQNAPENRPKPKRKAAFQPSIFRGF